MRPHREIQIEAERLGALGREYLAEQRGRGRGEVFIVPLPRLLARLPDSRVRIGTFPGADESDPHAQRRERHVEARMENDELMFCLVERECDLDAQGRLLRDRDPEAVMASPSSFDLLLAGYELVEQDRLAEALAPYVEHEDSDLRADPTVVAEVEQILEAGPLPAPDRMRAKAEIVDFLEGRLKASDFIEHAIDRQRLREVCVERKAERAGMRLTIDQE